MAEREWEKKRENNNGNCNSIVVVVVIFTLLLLLWWSFLTTTRWGWGRTHRIYFFLFLFPETTREKDEQEAVLLPENILRSYTLETLFLLLMSEMDTLKKYSKLHFEFWSTVLYCKERTIVQGCCCCNKMAILLYLWPLYCSKPWETLSGILLNEMWSSWTCYWNSLFSCVGLPFSISFLLSHSFTWPVPSFRCPVEQNKS